MKKKLTRTPLETSRQLDFFSEKELTTQTGHPMCDWPLVVLKELLDNAIDAAEDAGIAPAIKLTVDADGITVTDNGPGLPADTVAGVLDFGVRVSSREHYVSPTRGAQGNALKTIAAMPYVLDGKAGRVDIIAKGIRHEISITVDRIHQKPIITRHQHADRRFVKNGTCVKLYWPVSASSTLVNAKSRFLQIASNFTFLNPHLTLTLDWFGERSVVKATTTAWDKWLPSNPTSSHWYSVDRFGRLIAGYLADDEIKDRNRTIRELIAEFDGLTGTAKQKAVGQQTGLSRLNLSALRNCDGLDTAKVQALLDAMKTNTRPVKPAALGLIGEEHIKQRFREIGCEMNTFKYRKKYGQARKDAMPYVLEIAFAALGSAFDQTADSDERRLITGINWSPSIAANPFRKLGSESLDTILQKQRTGHFEPVVLLIHLTCPHVEYTDRGKSAVVIEDSDDGGQQDDL